MADGDEGKAKPRRLLMDDFWVKVQHKTFGKWVSMHLAKKGIPAVANLDQELKVFFLFLFSLSLSLDLDHKNDFFFSFAHRMA